MTIRERLARAKAGEAVSRPSALPSAAPTNRSSLSPTTNVYERLNIAKKAETPTMPVVPEQRSVFQSLKDAWGNTSAKDIASSFFEGGFNQYMSGLYGLIGTADEFVTGLLPKGVKDALGIPDDYVSSASDTADYYRQILEDDYQERTEGAGVLGKKAVELAQSAGNMLASAGMGAVATGGITAPPTTAAGKLIGNAGLLSLSASAAGSGAQEAKAKGATAGQALAYGALVGATEAVTEKLFGGNPLFDKSSGLSNRLISKITKNTKLLNFLASRPVEILNEGLEEMIAEIMAPVYERLTFNPNADFATLSEIIESAIDGIILSGVMQGGKAIVEAPSKAIQNRLENAKQAQPTPPQTSNIPATPPQSTQNDAIAQADIPIPQETKIAQNATESVTEPSIASISEMSKEDFKSNPPNGYKYKPSTSTTTQEAYADTTNGVIYLTDKFFDLSPDLRKRVLAHELNHFKSEAVTSNPENTELMQAIWGFTKSNPNTKYFVEKNVDEVVTELLTDYQENPEWLKEKHPQFYAIAENINNGNLDVAQYGDLSKYIPTYKQYPNTPDGNSLQILDDVIATNPELAKQKGWDVKAEELRQKVFGEQPQNATESVIEDTNIPGARIGIAGETYTAHNEPVRFRYAIVPADSLVTSHDRYGYTNKAYPVEMQPRDRTRVSSMFQVNKMSKELNPRRLAESAEAQNGAPIVRNDGVVISGNGRVLAIKAAYEDGFGANYETFLRENAAKYGIEGDLPPSPILVRISDNVDSFEKLAQTLNETATATYSATEYSMADANKMANILDLFVPNDDGRINTSDNTDFIRAFVDQVIPEAERGGAITKTGKLSQTGLNRARNAIFAAAYGDPELSAKLSEYTDDNTKNITNALLNTAPNALHIKTGIESGSLYNINIIEDVIQAARLYEYTKSTGSSIDEIINQTSMLEQYSPETQAIALFMEANKRSAKQIRLFLNSIYDAIYELGDPNQISLLGGEADGATKQDIINAATLDYLRNTEVENPNIGFSLDEYNMAAESRAAGGETTASEGAGETVVATNGNEATAGEVEWQDSFLSLPEGIGAMSKYPDVTNEQLIEQYGTVEKGKMPGARDVDLAAQSESGRTAKFAQTAAESGAVSDEVVQAIKQELPSGSYAYVPTPNKTALAHANETLASKGYETALADFQALMRSNQRVTVRDIVLGERLIQEASRRGDTETAARLIADVAVLGSEYGQTTQALNIIKRLSPEGQLMYLQRAVNRMNAKQAGKKLSADDYSELANLRQKLQEAESQLQEARSKGQNADAATKAIENLKKQINKISGELYIPQSVIDDILAQRGKGEKALQEAMDRAYTAIAEQMPANWYDKWNAWRYMAMLTNPTTHIRNILGNAIFVPVRKLKNTIAAGMESAFNVKERTKAVLTAKDKPLVEFAKRDFAEVEDAITSTGKMNPSNIIRDRRRIFKSNTLETIRTKNSWLLEAEDAIFLRNAYVDSLAQYMKANNLTPEFLSSGTEAAEVSLQKARAYAIQEAQKATYRDANAVAKWLNEAKRIKGLGVAIEGVVPFTKTPTNILRRGIEYSPIGLIKGLSYDLAQVKTGAKTATEAIDSIASGMSGTMILGLGIWLASLGLISGGGSDNDKERAFSDLQGEQNYALQIGDTSYTIDWLAPVALPLFVGVELYNALKSDGLTAAETIEGLSRVADPMLNLTMLQGLNRAIRTAAYAGDNALGALAIESASSYVGQAVPTVLGKAARTIDPVRRDTSATNKDSVLPAFVQKAINRNLAKIPFVSKTLPAYVDAWGREQVGESLALRLFENFFSPGYISKKETTAVEEELMRLYKVNSDRAVLPSLARSSFYDNGKQYTLSPDEFTRFKKTQGQTAYRLLEEAVSSEAYKSLSDEGKAKVVSDIYEYAREKAKEEYFDSRSIKIKRDTAKVVENADGAKKAGLDIVDFLATKLSLQNKKSEPARLYLLQRNDLTASQKAYLDKTLIGERKNPIDYTSEESFYLSQLTENQRNKYARVKQLLGFTAEEYSKYLSIMGKAGKKVDKINSLVEAGLSRQKAAQLYAILN